MQNEEIERLKKLIRELQDIHRVCNHCKEIGHRADMVQYQGSCSMGADGFMFPNYYHKACFKAESKQNTP